MKKVFGYLKEKKLTKIALVTATDPFGKDGAVLLKKLAPDFGLTFVAEESFGPKDIDMTSELTKIKNAGPDAIVCWTIGPAGAIVAKNKAQLGIAIPLFQCHGQPGPEYIQLAGKAAEGDRMPATKLMAVDELADNDPQKPVIKDFIKLYKDSGYDKQFPVNTHSGYAWDAINIVARQSVSSTLIKKAAQELILEYLGHNVSISSQQEGDEILLDLDTLIAGEEYTELFSDTLLAPLLSFWSDWDGSNRPSGQGHQLVAAALMENVQRMAHILNLLRQADPQVPVNPDLIAELERLPAQNQRFTKLLNAITALTHQLEQRYRGVLPFSVAASPLQRLTVRLRAASG